MDNEVHKLWISFLTSALLEGLFKSNDIFEYYQASAVKQWIQPQSLNEFAEIVSFLVLNPWVKKPMRDYQFFYRTWTVIIWFGNEEFDNIFLESSTAFLSERVVQIPCHIQQMAACMLTGWVYAQIF